MEIVQSIILGLIQGTSEFLPISSSGHLILIPEIFGWQDQGLAFDVALHWGTLIAVIAYFRKEWMNIIKESYLINKVLISNFQFSIFKQFSSHKLQITSFKFQTNPKFKIQNSKFKIQNSDNKSQGSQYSISNIQNPKSDLLFIIIIVTIPGIITGLLLNDYAEKVFRNPLLIAAMLSVGALLLFYSDKVGAKKIGIGNITLKDGVIIGLAQAIAIIPGLSRSGITIAAALLIGLDRTSAARFSFLLSAPIILGAGVKEFPNLVESGIDINIIFGAGAAALSGFAAIKYMLKYLERRNYNIFVVYRIILAAAIIYFIV